jgi:hypothetical protein
MPVMAACRLRSCWTCAPAIAVRVAAGRASGAWGAARSRASSRAGLLSPGTNCAAGTPPAGLHRAGPPTAGRGRRSGTPARWRRSVSRTGPGAPASSCRASPTAGWWWRCGRGPGPRAAGPGPAAPAGRHRRVAAADEAGQEVVVRGMGCRPGWCCARSGPRWRAGTVQQARVVAVATRCSTTWSGPVPNRPSGGRTPRPGQPRRLLPSRGSACFPGGGVLFPCGGYGAAGVWHRVIATPAQGGKSSSAEGAAACDRAVTRHLLHLLLGIRSADGLPLAPASRGLCLATQVNAVGVL